VTKFLVGILADRRDAMKLRSIQVLRAVAALAVLIHHSVSVITVDSEFRIGAAGVDLFFVISGFIMATIGPGRTPTQFIADRAWRILPLWWIAIFPWLVVKRPDLAAIASSLALWPIYGGSFHLPVLGVGWTLCFEMLFYAAFAAALASRWWIPIGAFALFLIAPKGGSAALAYLGSPMILEFLFGVMIARLPRIAAIGLPLILASLVALALSPVGFYDAMTGSAALERMLHWGIPAALIVYGSLSLERRFASAAFDAPVFLGNASYSIYLFHKLGELSHNWILNFAVSLAIGIAGYWFIERKVLAMQRGRGKRHEAAPIAAE
jgi:exopolysaccharide production protein ExoZ